MLTSKLKIEHTDKKFTLEQTSEELFLLEIYEGATSISFQLSVIELAALRNNCSRFLENYRTLKREREKRTGQGEVNLDR